MKYSELNAIAEIFQTKRSLIRCKRVGENALALYFEDERWVASFEASKPVLAPFYDEGLVKTFSAPFDRLLASRLNQSEIVKIALKQDDKILSITAVRSDGWKAMETTLILEFVPRRYNALLLDKAGVILESMRRTTRLQIDYEPPPAPPRKPLIEPIADIRAAMKNRLEAQNGDELKRRQAAAIAALGEKSGRIKRLLSELAPPRSLEAEADALSEEGTLMLANLTKIAPYSANATITDFDGRARSIALDRLQTPQAEAERKFVRARKLRAKAKGVFKERQNLEERLAFYDRLILAIGEAKTAGELESVLPRLKQKRGDRGAASEPIEEFIIGGFRALLGRNEKGNALLLKRAKARDIWFHLQGRPSAHLIVQTAKEELPKETIDRAAQLCARFSLSEKGDYLVDYTKRQFVKVEFGAHVTYSRQKSVAVRLD
ncbi:MAG: NFACT RNA binding domain-containing protein [Helicobacteraceae bacterium]|jgi:predicted ribosome quality control (RQC) complex YloA/Tae2 family protein|nr:NFACT RNA binding domain-containing protein [Helicobacteraceae bacterium]